MEGSRGRRIVKNLVYAIVLIAAVFLSFVFFILIAADPPRGAHPPPPVGLLLGALVSTIAIWVAVAWLNRWRKR